MLAVIDNNVWISALINPSGFPARVLDALIAGKFIHATSTALTRELEGVLGRPKFALKYGISAEAVRALLVVIGFRATFVDIPGTLAICRDANDNMVLETAVAARAQAIVTRDDDLKGDPVVAAFAATHGIELLTVQRFLDLFA